MAIIPPKSTQFPNKNIGKLKNREGLEAFITPMMSGDEVDMRRMGLSA